MPGRAVGGVVVEIFLGRGAVIYIILARVGARV